MTSCAPGLRARFVLHLGWWVGLLLSAICVQPALGQTPASMTSPSPGTTLSGSSVTFSWTAGTGVTGYWLYLGTSGAQSANIYNSGALSGTSITVNGLPTNGVTLYATLFSKINGSYQPVSYTYTEAGSPVLAAMTSPSPGTLSGSSVTFSWSAGSGPTGYWLYLGTTGPNSANIYSSGLLSGTSVTVNGIPTYGVTLYVTLFSKVNGAFQGVNYTYMEAGSPVLAALTSPSPGSKLSGSSVTFSWSAGGGPTAYWLYLGTTGVHSANLYSSGSLTGTSVSVSGLPTMGVTVYATLYSNVSGTWQPVSFTYTEAGTPVLAAMASPSPGSTLSGSSVTFSWSAGSGPTAYWLYLGTAAKSANLYSSGQLSGTSITVNGIPTNGVTLYATLYSLVSNVWQPVVYSYTEAGTPVLAAITSPAPGSTLGGASVTFSWSAGTGPTAYWLYLGTTGAHSADIYSSGSLSGTSVNVTGLPTNGVTLYATLYSLISGAWQPVSYTYTESGTPVLAAITSPAPGSILSSSSVTFTWSPGAGPTGYWLYLGTTGVGSADLYSSGSLSGTSVTVNGLPTNGLTWGTMDLWLRCNSPSLGATITTSVLTSCSTGNSSGGYTLSETPLTPMKIAASQGGLGAPVTVGSTTYPANSTTQSMSYDHQYDLEYFEYFLPTGVNTQIFNMNGYITFGAPINLNNDDYYDYVDSQDLNGHDGFVIQLHAGKYQGCTYCVFLETDPNFTLTHSATGIPVTQGTRYAFSVQANEVTGIASLALYNPTTFAQVGSTITSASQTGERIFNILAGNVETGHGAGNTSYIEDLMLDWSQHQTFPNIPSAPMTVYATLFSKINGAWQPVHYTYTN